MLDLYISLGNLLHKKPITEQIQYLDGIKALSILFAAELYALSYMRCTSDGFKQVGNYFSMKPHNQLLHAILLL